MVRRETNGSAKVGVGGGTNGSATAGGGGGGEEEEPMVVQRWGGEGRNQW